MPFQDTRWFLEEAGRASRPEEKKTQSVDKNMCYEHTHMHDLGAEQEKGVKEWNINTYMGHD